MQQPPFSDGCIIPVNIIFNSVYTLTYDNIILPYYGQTAYLSDGLHIKQCTIVNP